MAAPEATTNEDRGNRRTFQSGFTFFVRLVFVLPRAPVFAAAGCFAAATFPPTGFGFASCFGFGARLASAAAIA